MRLTQSLANLFDRLFTEKKSAALEHGIVWLAVSGFAVHIGLIFLSRRLEPADGPLSLLGTNYLAALYTPFSFILFYEVLLLIASIPRSTTGSLGRQYEIISLIVLRNVFKDIAEFDSFQIIEEEITKFIDVLIDMGGGLLMFLFVAIFYHIRDWQTRTLQPTDRSAMTPQLEAFIQRKKAVALLLASLLFTLAAYNLGRWILDVYQATVTNSTTRIDIGTIFYLDLFTVMIFTDVLILLFSMLQADDY
ncbi:MAG: hypothetical protein AAF725_09365, partial [Acidobacteriota bacterium]